MIFIIVLLCSLFCCISCYGNDLESLLTRLRIRDDLHCVHSDFQFQVESYPYDPNLMVFMDYRDYTKQKDSCLEAEYPTFLYAMAMSPTRVFFEVLLDVH